MSGRTLFVTGGTGYIGGRLVPRLLDAGHRVRCLSRSRRKLAARPWANREGVEVIEADAADHERLKAGLTGCQAAYYLVHSMVLSGSEYARRDRELALGFARAAEAAGVERLIYLGGLGESGAGLSEHLTSRREVEAALASTSVPLTALRAAMVIGAGSASFEILRYLVERLPVMVTPRWVGTESQPIAVTNVLHDLVACLEVEETVGATLDIGGPDVLSYRELMQLVASARGLPRRIIIPVPVLTPRLSSLWIHLVTPLGASIARPLAEGLRNRVVCRDDRAARLMPQRLLGAREAIEAALGQLDSGDVETSWSDAGTLPGDPDWAGGSTFLDRRTTAVEASPHHVFAAFCHLGGATGWHAMSFLWRLRGFLDHLVGGPGLRRGRRDPERLGFGDALDFWRVTDVEQDRRLELRAEMKLPGEARLQFTVAPIEDRPGWSDLVIAASFVPRGLLGMLYWYAVLPFHALVFRGMLTGMKREAEDAARRAEAVLK